MADLFKNLFSTELFEHIANVSSKLNNKFNKIEFKERQEHFIPGSTLQAS